MSAWTQDSAIAAVKAEAERIGRTPMAKDMRARRRTRPLDLPPIDVVYDLFGSLPEFHRAAQLTPTPLGPRAGALRERCRNGHRLTPENVYVYARPNPKKPTWGPQRRCRICDHAKRPRRWQKYQERKRALAERIRVAARALVLQRHWGIAS